MDADSRLPVLVFTVLVLLIAIPVAVWQVRERSRPTLAGVHVVTATDSDPVFRDGPRHVAGDEDVRLAVALRIYRPWRGSYWLAPVDELEIEGQPLEHVKGDSWPDRDRALRVFWFTVECSRIGGDLTAENAAKQLRYRTFLAPELGHGLTADGEPEAHNDDHLGAEEDRLPVRAGTLHLYARVEVVGDVTDVQAIQAATSRAVDHLPDPRFTTLHRQASLPAPLRPAAGELFLLPGFEPKVEGEGDVDGVTEAAFGVSFSEMVERRLVTSSRTLAAVAVTGTAELPQDALVEADRITVWEGSLERHGRPVRWSDDVRPGDLLVSGSHWIVLLEDDGNGILDREDRVMHSWRRPPAVLSLGHALDPDMLALKHYRHGP